MSEPKKLYRSSQQKLIFGVCGGLGEYFNIDPVLVRLICILIAIPTGFIIMLVIYLIAGVIMPKDTDVNNF